MNFKIAAGTVIIGAIAIAGAYTLGTQQGQETPAAVAPTVGSGQLQSTMTGKAGGDPSEKFTHFQVGNKNVKKIFIEDNVVWVATSGGVIRYDTRSDEYKLYDNSNGLLSNGMFYVGRVQGKITVGTYGGGMSMLDPMTKCRTDRRSRRRPRPSRPHPDRP
jgi:hypothetical protein